MDDDGLAVARKVDVALERIDTETDGVIERCDTGPNRVQNVGAIDTAIADYNKRVEGVCKR